MNIFVVEDDKDILDFLKHALKEEGFVVDAAGDGSVGLEKALANDYDLIILDNILPGKTGREICTEIRKKGKDTRILMLSVGAEAEIKAEILNLGADDYLCKPFTLSELLARVRALLRRPEKTQKEILRIKNLSLDQRSRVVRRSGRDIHLTPKEFTLLEYMMRHPGKILSRIEILEHVWDMNADLFTNTVEAHILNIRKKIGDQGEKSLIHTVAGAGYRIS